MRTAQLRTTLTLRGVDADGVKSKVGGVTDNDCCGVSDRFVCVGISEAHGDGVVHGGAEDEGGIAREEDVEGAGASSDGSIGKHYNHVNDRFVSEGGIGHGGMSGASRSSTVVVGGSEQLDISFRRPDALPPITREHYRCRKRWCELVVRAFS